jgi:formylglycine-generating enzyme required for sulfatase activity
MSEHKARSTPVRIILLAGMLLGVTALLVAFPPAAQRATPDALDHLLSRVERMALVVPPRESAVAPFFIDRFETTNAEVEQFLVATGYVPDDPSGFLPGFASLTPPQPTPGRGNHPATGLTARDAAAIASWKGKRLPTVAEWQVAADEWARGVSSGGAQTSRFQFNLYEAGIADTTRVGTFESGRTSPRSVYVAPPVYDLIGNVAEWAEADPNRGPSGSQPLVGGSFLDSTDRALDRSAAEFGLPGERSFAVGMRTVLPAANRWVRELLVAFAAATPEQRRATATRLRRISGPLERLLERTRVEEAIVANVPLANPIAITDELESLGDGRVLRIQKAGGYLELIDVKRGVIDSASGIGSVRDYVVHDAHGGSPRITMLTTDPESDVEPPTHCLLLDGDRMFAFDRVSGLLLTDLDERSVTIPSGPWWTLPNSVLVEPLKPGRFVLDSGRRPARIIEVTIGENGLDCRVIGRAAALVDLFGGGGGSFVFGSATVRVPWTPDLPALVDCVTPDYWNMVFGLDVRDSRRLNALLVRDLRGGVLPDRDADFACLLAHDGAMFTLREFTAGRRTFTRTTLDEGDRGFARALALPDGFIAEIRDEARRVLEIRRFDLAARLIERRELPTEGSSDPRVVDLGADRLVLFDSEGAVHRLDAGLRDSWVTRPEDLSADFAVPVLADVDRDGRDELVSAAGMRSVVRVDFATGEILDRVTHEGVDVLALIPMADDATGCGLAAAVVSGGFAHLRPPTSREANAARELAAMLREPAAGGTAP